MQPTETNEQPLLIRRDAHALAKRVRVKLWGVLFAAKQENALTQAEADWLDSACLSLTKLVKSLEEDNKETTQVSDKQ